MTKHRESEQHVTQRVTQHVTRIVAKVVIFLIIAIAVFGVAVYQLWNWLMPSLFHLPAISFWQAVGLLALSWLLFGGLRGFRGPRSVYHRNWRRRMGERWEQMTPEEREKFLEVIGRFCGAAKAEPKA